MLRGIWVHQFNQLSERTPAEIAGTLIPRGIKYVYVKTHDGVYWMNQVYSHPMAPSAQNFPDLVAQFDDVGLTLVPWVFPRRGRAGEANAHAIAGKMAGGSLIVDFEWQYAGFFEGNIFDWRQYRDTLLGHRMEWTAIAPDPRQIWRDFVPDEIAGFQAYL